MIVLLEIFEVSHLKQWINLQYHNQREHRLLYLVQLLLTFIYKQLAPSMKYLQLTVI